MKSDHINIVLNDQPFEVECTITVEKLLQQLNRHQPGTALAVNQVIVPRTDWEKCQLHAGDNILLFQAIAGG
ncbi:sulfur carrier protein ThiS [Yersinia enterocolitica]|uniref:Thiamine biosynthesis protein n=1 Tax=Yersinia enterocolitica serotype O:8 / biotype 1B (strain NCTC 13174 / 8081) TaxID=393305 RepID=A1JII5_YERE8|nr:sulfur carrier protein ThiS [Yersinia enterocolitica]AJJ21596.1 thiamine biosynthesis protein ThiS [Yersinia enterocolitica]ELI8285106.1 sulfur carrier protein ThiS [Yersinia enterocolitica]KGA77118.1 thiamine biosynthesis protein ThiS [Yersinia enterocolitica]MCE3129945.1 sulfur carrier protein ThiS [Yersinia enterocolitica]PNM22112.1 sulfur carrier protein ThiS [Yersinia enterocolitica]